jgi:hypothetical protein
VVLVTLLNYGQVMGSKAKTALSEVTARGTRGEWTDCKRAAYDQALHTILGE